MLSLNSVDLGAEGSSAAMLHSLPPTEPEVASRSDHTIVLVPRLVAANYVNRGSSKSGTEPSTHLVTGGTGGLGLLTANWLSSAEASSSPHLVLISRSGTLHSEAATKLRECNGLTIRSCDVSEWLDARSNLAAIHYASPPLRGVCIRRECC